MKDNRNWIKSIYPPKKIHVKILGQIVNPGIYELEENEQILDLIKKAGGLKNHSNAEIPDTELYDGQIVNIGDKGI